MANFTIYNPLTGEILRSGSCVESDVELQIQPGEALVLGASNDVLHYVLNGEIVDRPSFNISKTEIVADDLDEAVIADLPDPITVTVDGVAYEVTGGSLAITSPMPATYNIEIDHWPYLPFSTEVTAS